MSNTEKKVETKQAAPAKKPTTKAAVNQKAVRKLARDVSREPKKVTKQQAHAHHLRIVRKQRYMRFVIDCDAQAKAGIIEPAKLEHYLKTHIKVNNKTHNLSSKVKTKLNKNRVIVLARPPFSKRYLKYLTRRYLKKQVLRDWIRVVSQGHNTYKLSYYKIQQNDEGDESE
ncbi:putative 60S ribosomal protein L22 [Blattamonas nauphoetae]|uniref:Large ribosomal subunit protein eL22 n=1 Tax=Blattamonas nauphoetae TaxID=2049346 RepID=A0ABQ9YKT1_9EUKA|nr:putative 60S ribosomal protein L22 [Blattamonas nauphoetae]